MNIKIMRTARMLAIFFICLSLISPALKANNPQDEDTKTYKQAYSLVLGENWEKAHKELDRFIQKFPRSTWTDDACFWQCYAREKLDYDLEEVYGCFDKFIKAYPESQWVNDAKSNMVRIAYLLAKEGKPKYEALIKSMKTDEDLDIKMTALYALEDMGDEEALEAVISLYDGSPDKKIRLEAVDALEEIDTPKARAALLRIIKK
jgi:tetratricopeptide (TPR) repeat protein